jgi:hypothetical protein
VAERVQTSLGCQIAAAVSLCPVRLLAGLCRLMSEISEKKFVVPIVVKWEMMAL